MRQVESGGVLSSSVLVLNRAFLAVHVINVRRAFKMVYREMAEVIDIDDGHFANYDFESWLVISDLRSAEDREFDEWVRSVNFKIQVPRVIRLLRFDRVPRQTLRFNRRNLFARDGNRCQYCGQHAPPQQLSMDHVVPRSRGGKTTWGEHCLLLRQVQHAEGWPDAERSPDATAEEAGQATLQSVACTEAG